MDTGCLDVEVTYRAWLDWYAVKQGLRADDDGASSHRIIN